MLQDIHWSSGPDGQLPYLHRGQHHVGRVHGRSAVAISRTSTTASPAAITARSSAWLTQNIYRHGRAFSPSELLISAPTGRTCRHGRIVAYLEGKFGELYGEKEAAGRLCLNLGYTWPTANTTLWPPNPKASTITQFVSTFWAELPTMPILIAGSGV